jgi:hypothetical protein
LLRSIASLEQSDRGSILMGGEDLVGLPPNSHHGAGPVLGVVVDVQFKGGSSQVAVDVPGFPRPFLVSVPGPTEVCRGQGVSLDWTTSVIVSDELA